MKGLREIADKHGILLIFDEVQSGFGRTGKWFALEHFGVLPDIITAAKGLASGMPLSGVFSRLDLMKKWETGSHGGTYGGNAVACASAIATIQAMREEKMLENALARGVQLMTGLRKLQEEYPQIGDVRGKGLDDRHRVHRGRAPRKGQAAGQVNRPCRRGTRPAPAHLRDLRQHHPLDSPAERHRLTRSMTGLQAFEAALKAAVK